MANDKDEAAAVERENNERYVEGLREELAGYERRGPDYSDRADQVRGEIRRCGGKVSDASASAPAGRGAPRKETAAGQARPAAPTAGRPAETTTDTPGVDVK